MIDYEHWKLLDESRGVRTHWQVLGYPQFLELNHQGIDVSRILASGKDIRQAAMAAATPLSEPVYPLNPVKHVRVCLDNSSVILEPGALQFMKGSLEMTTQTSGGAGGGSGGLFRRAAGAMASGQSIVKTHIKGSGEIFMEPQRQYLFLVEAEESKIMCDKGMFIACDGSMEVGAEFLGMRAAAASGEGGFLPVIQGTGVVALSSPVPLSRILRVELNNEELKVDGPYAMLSMGELEFSVEKSAKGLLSSAASGEGMLNVYRGTGQVWINLQEAQCYPSTSSTIQSLAGRLGGV